MNGSSSECRFGTGNGVIVVVRIAEAAITSDDFLIEIAEAADAVQRGIAIDARVKLDAAANAPQHLAQEMPLVHAVGRPVQGGGRNREIHQRRDADQGLQLRRRRGTGFACVFKDVITAH
jgi:hypothetical protein